MTKGIFKGRGVLSAARNARAEITDFYGEGKAQTHTLVRAAGAALTAGALVASLVLGCVAAARALHIANIEYILPTFTYEEMGSVTSDPFVKNNAQYYLDAAGITSAWETSRADGNITVAVLDTGVMYDHEDLTGRIVATYGWDAVENKSYLTSQFARTDPLGHGTMVAGIIAATADNSVGIAGVSYNAKILPVRIFKSDNTSTSEILLNALNKIDSYLESGAVPDLKIINMSFGTYTYDRAVHQIIRHLYNDHGVLMVSSGGNGSDDGTANTARMYPADLDEVVSVTALDAAGAVAAWSDYNVYKDIAASGESILSTYADGGYAWGKGTSFASPIVAGAAALIWAQYPAAGVADMMSAIKSSATALGVDKSVYGIAGALDASGALSAIKDKFGEGQMFRLYNPSTGEHLYTASTNEKITLAGLGWNFEGVGWVAPASGAAVYRLYNPNTSDHHYTTDTNERDTLVRLGWRYEGVGWYSADGGTAVYRQFNPNAQVGAHNFTTSTAENDALVGEGWRAEGIAWYGL